MRRTVAVVACTLGLVVAGAGAASAGEITGNGKPLPVNGRSECAYSGLNDEPGAPGPEGGRTQSYGQLVKGGYIAPQQFNPSMACNPNAAPPAP
ncbi:hypothetical protein [Cellulomonas endophytica]|uniref:hypothetical protein n=1 Tax=Cellulomonas endophytica TaxID=2494735 RepID=UPI001012BC99|nr:hypothetical protein [Cellulomonas endophytica]